MTNTSILAGVAAVAAVVVAMLLAYAARTVKSPLVQAANRLAVLGYALPGAVIAVGILLPLGKLDNAFIAWMHEAVWREHRADSHRLGHRAHLRLSRAFSRRGVSNSRGRADTGDLSMDDAARSLGLSPGRTLVRVHMPIMRGSLATAALLVFVDVMKELPATFAMRPFNFDTLAVEAYNLAKDERIAEAAVPALLMVAIALVAADLAVAPDRQFQPSAA